MRRARPEVMAPAGNAECLRAAVRAGADAVYFGLGAFNARARADNFSETELGPVLRELHERAVRGYVTLNTLVFDDELDRVEQAVRACAAAGVDAVIVQDLGVAALVRAVAPSLPVHASTQMTCSDLHSVELARSLGAERVTLARELSLEQIAAIARTTAVELEVFVHGALCISYSGQCFASLAFGGRSGNRGACAQACRLPYELVVDGAARRAARGPFLLSPHDLDASELVAELAALGVAALKIEGRLKGPDYVYAATRLYRLAVDRLDREAEPSESASLERERHVVRQLFSRGQSTGYLRGIDHGQLVSGASSDHIGVPLGLALGVRQLGAHRCIAVELGASLERGAGLLVAAGRADEPCCELGGRVWELFDQQGRNLARGEPGQTVLVWLGPDVELEPTGREPSLVSGARVFVTNDPRVSRELELDRSSRERRVPLELRLEGQLGESARLSARSLADGRQAELLLDVTTERARGEPSTPERVRAKLGQLGTSPFVLESCEVALPAEAFIPDAALKRARRAVVEALGLQASRTHAVTARGAVELAAEAMRGLAPLREATGPVASGSVATEAGASGPVATEVGASGSGATERVAGGLAATELLPAGLVVLCRREDQVGAALDEGAHTILLELGRVAPYSFFLPAEDALAGGSSGGAWREHATRIRRAIRERGAACGLALPRIRQPGDRPLEPFIEALEPDVLLVRHLGALADRVDVPRVADHSFNVANRLSAAALLGHGLGAFTPALDLDADRLLGLLEPPLARRAEVLVHHHMPLFHTQYCPFAAELATGPDCHRCGAPCTKHSLELRDRRGAVHPVTVDIHGRATVHEGSARSHVGLAASLGRAGVRRFRIELTVESPAAVRSLVGTFRALVPPYESSVPLRGQDIV